MTVREAIAFALAMPPWFDASPQIVPMTRGRLQLEWHQGKRSLELEFGGVGTIRYLQWDTTAHPMVAEEGEISIADTEAIHELLRWFMTR
jgi:hypothetical protein